MDLTEALKEKVYRSFGEQKFVGMVKYSEREYKELLEYTSHYSRSFAVGIGSYLYGENEVHFVTLVEIAKRWKAEADNDEDKGYWTFVFSLLRVNYSGGQKVYKAFTELINALSQHKNLPIADTPKRYYATIMMHAFAPNKSLNAFFDFVYNIFKKDLDFGYTDTDKEICDLATEGFCDIAKNLGGKNVDVSIGSGVYSIKIGLRCMALNNDTRVEFIALLDKTLNVINLLYHGKEVEKNNYLDELVQAWWESKTEKDLTRSSNEKHIQATTKQNFVPKFIRRDEKVYLIIPSIRFASGEEPKLWLSIYVNGEDNPIVSEEIFTRRGEITVTSVQQDIELNGLLQNASDINLRVVITENGREIVNKLIEREFLLFDNEKEVVGKILNTGNYFVYSLSIDKLQLPIVISGIAKNLYNIYPEEGETLSGNQRQIIFTNKLEATTVFDNIRLIGNSEICTWGFQDKICKVFGGRIILFVPQSSVNGLELRVNGKRKLLSDINSILEEGHCIFDISDSIPQREPCGLIIYSHLKEKELLHNDIVSIQKLNIAFSQPIYYGYIDKKVRISVGAQFRDLSWSYGDETVACHLCKGTLEITIPQFKWRIDGSDWHYGPMHDIIWYKDHFNSGSVLEVNAPIDNGAIKLYCVGDGLEQEISQDKLSRFEIGKFIYANEKRKVLLFFFKSFINADRKKVCEVTTVEHFIQEPPFVVEDNKLRFVGDELYVGDKKPYFKIALRRIGRDEISIKSTELSNGIMPEVDAGIYWIKVSSPSGGLFTASEKILWEGEYVFGDKDKLKLSNIVLKINPIWGITTSFWKESSTGYYISSLVREENTDTYTAKLYHMNSRKEKSNVCGYSECRIEIISSTALQLRVKDSVGNYVEQLKCDNSGNLYSPHSQELHDFQNYNFIEVKNV